MAAYPRVAPTGTPYGPLVHFRTQGVVPPQAAYIAPGDAVEFEGRSPSVSVTVQLTLRILTPQGEVKELTDTETFSTVGLGVQTKPLNPTEGMLLSAHVSSNNASRGQCFIRVYLRKNPGASDVTLGALLIQGYVSTDDHLSYPQSPVESSLNGRGWTHTVVVPSPGLGSNWTLNIPVGVRWLIKAFKFGFFASGAAGNRSILVFAKDAAFNIIAEVGSFQVLTAGQSAIFTFAAGMQNNTLAAGAIQTGGWPADLILPTSYSVASGVNGLDAADQFQGINFAVEEWVAQ